MVNGWFPWCGPEATGRYERAMTRTSNTASLPLDELEHIAPQVFHLRGPEALRGAAEDLVPDDLPALRNGETLRVPCAEVVAMRLGFLAERTKDRHGV